MVAPVQSDVLQRLIHGQNGDLPPEVARTVLAWRFADSDQARLAELSAKARSGTLSDSESRQLDWYLLLGDFLAILQSKARTSLRKHSSAA
jgi:hypothetical protein